MWFKVISDLCGLKLFLKYCKVFFWGLPNFIDFSQFCIHLFSSMINLYIFLKWLFKTKWRETKASLRIIYSLILLFSLILISSIIGLGIVTLNGKLNFGIILLFALTLGVANLFAFRVNE